MFKFIIGLSIATLLSACVQVERYNSTFGDLQQIKTRQIPVQKNIVLTSLQAVLQNASPQDASLQIDENTGKVMGKIHKPWGYYQVNATVMNNTSAMSTVTLDIQVSKMGDALRPYYDNGLYKYLLDDILYTAEKLKRVKTHMKKVQSGEISTIPPELLFFIPAPLLHSILIK